MSPAGSYEGVVAAVRGGADAVYFGAGNFNARRNAKNLSDDELGEALKYCRLRGVKTYLTVNTLLTDRELTQARKLIEQLSALGADAVIVQDLGLARLIRAVAPDLPMHGSTQMTVHNLAGVLAAQRLGFSRVVLSREVPFSELSFICERAPIEIEVFCHGALCMCYSGQCYLSALIGGRSGNRGLCAQPCRMAYSFFGDAPGYPLSLKDLSLAGHLSELSQAGVACVKIEGRMKRPEYTALVTHIFKQAIASGQPPSRTDLAKLERVFSRDGFTDGYFTGKKGPHMFGTRQEGEGKETRALYQEAQKLYTGTETPSVPIDMHFTCRQGQRMRLTCVDLDGNEYHSEAAAPDRALTRATGPQEVEASLRKTGGTVFAPRRVEVELDQGLRAPASTVNAMRRQCLEGLAAKRRQPPRRAKGEWKPGAKRLPHQGPPAYIYSFLKFEQITPAMLEMSPAFLYLPVGELYAQRELTAALIAKGQRVAAVLDRVTFDGQWPDLLEKLRALKKAGVEDLVCTNLGQPALLGELGFRLRGDFGLNVMNTQTLKELKGLGLESATLSFELNFAQIRDLSLPLDGELIVYGRLPLMVMENCVIKNRTGACACDGAPTALIDKTGRSFPLTPEPGCRNTLLNAEKLYLADKKREIEGLGMAYLRLNFTTENDRECLEVARAYAKGVSQAPDRITRGLYIRGVQ